MHPETAFEEHRTASIVAERLRRLGYEVHEGVGRTGVVGVLEGSKPGRTIMLRADMDALPIVEGAKPRLPFAERRDACTRAGTTGTSPFYSARPR